MHRSIFRHKYNNVQDSNDVYCFCDPQYKGDKQRRELSENFLSLFIEKNSDGTKNLRLKGNELQFRIKRRIETKDMELITTFIKKFRTLVKLDLSYNRIDDGGMQILCDRYLKHENPLLFLNLTGCDILCGGIHSLCECWPTLKLKVLKLTGNKFGSECGDDFYTLLSKGNTLEQLHIGATEQTIASFPHFMAAIREDGGNNESLKILDISDIMPMSRVYQPQPDFLAEHLSTMFQLNKTLKELHLQKCGLDGHAMEKMIVGLKENKSLMLLDLGFNKVGNFGAEKLAEYFMTAPQLQGIILAGNAIGEIGGRALSFGLPYSKLRLIDLSQNKIPDKPLCEILLSIKKYHRMRVFFIFGNEIGDLSKEALERQFMAGVYEQANIDFQLFRTPEGMQVAKYPTNNYKHFVYNQLDGDDVRDLKIRHNKLPGYYCAEHGKINFENYRVDTGPCVENAQYEPVPFYTEEELKRRCLEKERLALLCEEDSTSSTFGLVSDSSSDSCRIINLADVNLIETGRIVSFTDDLGKSRMSQRTLPDDSSKLQKEAHKSTTIIETLQTSEKPKTSELMIVESNANENVNDANSIDTLDATKVQNSNK